MCPASLEEEQTWAALQLAAACRRPLAAEHTGLLGPPRGPASLHGRSQGSPGDVSPETDRRNGLTQGPGEGRGGNGGEDEEGGS